MYRNSIDLTQQFRFCGNAFRVDLYKGCTFGCKYCFANSMQTLHHNTGFECCDFADIKKYFTSAFESEKPTTNRIVECLRHKVPLHCGGMSDPFQPAEFKYKLTYELIKLCAQYQYPIIFSTKAASLPEEYYDILDPNFMAFQLSIIGLDDDYIRKYELNTPSAYERLEFLQNLKYRGFWCSIRIQPLIDIEQAIKLIQQAGELPSYYTVEHLKIPVDNAQVKQLFAEEYQNNIFYRSSVNLRNIELNTSEKIKNIDRIKAEAGKFGILVGVGDNDLHRLSQSRCCCGVDTINDNFNNWLKYNMTYFMTGNVEENIWCPKSNVASCFYSGTRPSSFTGFKQAVDLYIKDNEHLFKKDECSKIYKITGVRINQKLF